MSTPKTVTMTRTEFDQFWDEVLGDIWCMEDDGVPDEVWESKDPGILMTFVDDGLFLYLQGTCDPKPTAWYTDRDLREGLNFFALVDRWRAKRQVVSLVAEIPPSVMPEVLALIERVGGTVITPTVEAKP
jgi:hypothetical protein